METNATKVTDGVIDEVKGLYKALINYRRPIIISKTGKSQSR